MSRRNYPNEVVIPENILKKQPWGKITDLEMSKRLGCTLTKARKLRVSRGVEARGQKVDLSCYPLGLATDSKIAEMAKVHKSTVRRARKDLGIPPFRAVRLSKDKWKAVDWSMTDDDIGKAMGCCGSTVCLKRKEFGVAPSAPTSSKRRGINWDAQPLGKKPDLVIAKELGVGPNMVKAEREAHNIPTWSETRTCPCGKEFVATQDSQRWCSKNCSNVAVYAKRNGLHEELKVALVGLQRTIKERMASMA